MAKECPSRSTCSKSSCEGCSRKPADFSVAPNELTHVKHVIGIVSGKGGVGKSSVTACLALELSRRGYGVGILDADITGPSIPRMFGVKTLGGMMGELMLPAESETGIRIISLNLLIREEDSPVIWRGPIIAGAVKQFWSDVVWGDLDYLLVDMPPGTGDVPLTVFQSLPVEGVLLVTSPQSLVEMVENFSYVVCPDCGKKLYVFGQGSPEKWSAETGIPVCARLPFDPELAELADAGRIESYPGGGLDDVLQVLPA